MFPEAVTIFVHNFKRKLIRYWILKLQVASALSATSYCFLSEYWSEIKWIQAFNNHSTKTGNVWTSLGNPWNTIWLVDDGRLRRIECISSLGGKRSDTRGSVRGFYTIDVRRWYKDGKDMMPPSSLKSLGARLLVKKVQSLNPRFLRMVYLRAPWRKQLSGLYLWGSVFVPIVLGIKQEASVPVPLCCHYMEVLCGQFRKLPGWGSVHFFSKMNRVNRVE